MKKLFYLFGSLLWAGCVSAPSVSVVTPEKGDFQVWYELFKPNGKKTLKRTVLILPPTGGVTFLERSYASSMAKKGATVKLIQKWTGMNHSSLDLELHQNLHQLAMDAIKEVIGSCPEDHQLSLMGTSVGGIFAAVAASEFDRLETVVSIAGGSPIPELIVHSDYSTMKTLREKRIKNFNFENKAEYLAELDKRFSLNPHTMPKKFKNKRLGQIIMLKDKAVPTFSQKKLRELWNPSFSREINAGHLSGIIKAWWFFSDDLENFLISK